MITLWVVELREGDEVRYYHDSGITGLFDSGFGEELYVSYDEQGAAAMAGWFQCEEEQEGGQGIYKAVPIKFVPQSAPVN